MCDIVREDEAPGSWLDEAEALPLMGLADLDPGVMEAIGRTGWRLRTVKMRQRRVMFIEFTQHALLNSSEHVRYVLFLHS